MEVRYKPSFLKDFNKLPGKKIQKVIYKICFEEVPQILQLADIKNLKKIKGYDNYYRIRKGDFRIGFKYENGCISFLRVLGRSDIYKRFP